MPILRRNINAADDRATKLGEEHGADAEALQNALIEDQKNGPFNRLKNKIPENIRNSRIVYHLFYNVTRDINDHITTDKHVQFVHENAEAFDPKTEMLFRYLQVYPRSPCPALSSCCRLGDPCHRPSSVFHLQHVSMVHTF